MKAGKAKLRPTRCCGCNVLYDAAHTYALCAACLDNIQNTSCAGCGRRFAQDPDVVSAGGRPWHSACLRVLHPSQNRSSSTDASAAAALRSAPPAAWLGHPSALDLAAADVQGGRSFASDPAAGGASLSFSSSPAPLDEIYGHMRGYAGAEGIVSAAHFAGTGLGPMSGGGLGGDRGHLHRPTASSSSPSSSLRPSVAYPVPLPFAAAFGGTDWLPARQEDALYAAVVASASSPLGVPPPRRLPPPVFVQHPDAPPSRAFTSFSLEGVVQRALAMGLAKERSYRFKTYKGALVARELVGFLVTTRQCRSRDEAVEVGRALVDARLLLPAAGEATVEFEDKDALLFTVNLRRKKSAREGVLAQSSIALQAGGGGGAASSTPVVQAPTTSARRRSGPGSAGGPGSRRPTSAAFPSPIPPPTPSLLPTAGLTGAAGSLMSGGGLEGGGGGSAAGTPADPAADTLGRSWELRLAAATFTNHTLGQSVPLNGPELEDGGGGGGGRTFSVDDGAGVVPSSLPLQQALLQQQQAQQQQQQAQQQAQQVQAARQEQRRREEDRARRRSTRSVTMDETGATASAAAAASPPDAAVAGRAATEGETPGVTIGKGRRRTMSSAAVTPARRTSSADGGGDTLRTPAKNEGGGGGGAGAGGAAAPVPPTTPAPQAFPQAVPGSVVKSSLKLAAARIAGAVNLFKGFRVGAEKDAGGGEGGSTGGSGSTPGRRSSSTVAPSTPGDGSDAGPYDGETGAAGSSASDSRGASTAQKLSFAARTAQFGRRRTASGGGRSYGPNRIGRGARDVGIRADGSDRSSGGGRGGGGGGDDGDGGDGDESDGLGLGPDLDDVPSGGGLGGLLSGSASLGGARSPLLGSLPTAMGPGGMLALDLTSGSGVLAALAQPEVWRDQRRRLAALRAEYISRVWKQGWLWKQGHVRKNWKRRWFILRGFELSYAKKAPAASLADSAAAAAPSASLAVNAGTDAPGTPSSSSAAAGAAGAAAALPPALPPAGLDVDPAGIIDIRDYSLEKAVVPRSPLCLRLSAKRVMDNEYLIYAENEQDFVAWVKVLSAAMRAWDELGVGIGALQLSKNSAAVTLAVGKKAAASAAAAAAASARTSTRLSNSGWRGGGSDGGEEYDGDDLEEEEEEEEDEGEDEGDVEGEGRERG
jgi:hypothetical protein